MVAQSRALSTAVVSMKMWTVLRTNRPQRDPSKMSSLAGNLEPGPISPGRFWTRQNRNIMGKPRRRRDTPITGCQEEAAAALQEKDIRSIQNCKELNRCIQGSSSVPEQLATKYERKRLFDEVWRTPMRALAGQYGVSDSALREACCRL